MKKGIKLSLSMIFAIIFLIVVQMNYKESYRYRVSYRNYGAQASYSNEQIAIREVANAYYQRGKNIQYCSHRRDYTASPEDGTSQHSIYSVCSNFTFSVYYQAFGMKIPYNTDYIICYAYNKYTPTNITTNDVIEYWEKTENSIIDNRGNTKNIDLVSENGRKNYGAKILQDYNLQVGDLICYQTGSAGHIALVYEIIYNNGIPVDALMIEASGKYDTKSTKITKGLSYADVLNTNTNVHEGTLQKSYLINDYITSSTVTRKSILYRAQDKKLFAILRPLLKDENGNYTGEYNYSEFTYNENGNPTRADLHSCKKESYSISSITSARMNYSGITIEKTVDKFNNSVVGLGDILEYSIKIKNNSEYNYNEFEVIENISDYVEIVNTGDGQIENNKIVWNIQNLNSKNQIEIKYKVRVKNNPQILKKQIISYGTVAGIPSGTIKNVISSNLTNEQKINLINAIQLNIKAGYNGKTFINKVYNDAINKNIELDRLSSITDLVKTTDTKMYDPNNPSIYLNSENSFYNMVLSNYYGAVYTDSSNNVYLKNWELYSELGNRSQRAETIYKDNFQTGDVLIYKNQQTPSGDVTYVRENGVYNYIYIDEQDKITVDGIELYGFIGTNANGALIKFTNNNNNLQTLLGKDYYVILRPSLEFVEATEKNIGDVNENNEIDIGDILLLLRHMAQSNNANVKEKHPDWELNNEKKTIGDLNKNGKIDIGDILKLKRYIAAKNNSEVATRNPNWLILE